MVIVVPLSVPSSSSRLLCLYRGEVNKSPSPVFVLDGAGVSTTKGIVSHVFRRPPSIATFVPVLTPWSRVCVKSSRSGTDNVYEVCVCDTKRIGFAKETGFGHSLTVSQSKNVSQNRVNPFLTLYKKRSFDQIS